jgi:enoyl-CoA hydratase
VPPQETGAGGAGRFLNLTMVQADAVVTVTLERPSVRNALDTATLRELARAVREIRRAPDVRAVVLTGAGDKAFSAGADIVQMAAMSAAEGQAYSRLGHEVMHRLEALEVPVIAAVNGAALGGGFELALACDLIVAAAGARFGLPEVTLGLMPGFGGTQRLVARLGLARARELIYRGRTITAEEAERLGLVVRVVAAERLGEEAAALAAELAAAAPVALRQAKRATAVAVDANLATGCRFETEAFAVVFGSEDRREGLRAFLEKRRPVWRGR